MFEAESAWFLKLDSVGPAVDHWADESLPVVHGGKIAQIPVQNQGNGLLLSNWYGAWWNLEQKGTHSNNNNNITT